ncbi:MAG TPA: glycosyltransferase family 4 protein [Chitinophagaceae bacterium]
MSRNKKTLVILIPGFPANEADTTCLPMQQSFTRNLKELYPGLEIIILSFQYPYFKKRYQWFGIPVISFDGRNKGGLNRLLLRQRLYKILKEIHRSSEVTGLLSFWFGECALVGKKFAEKYGLPHYCWLMGQDAKKENKYPGQLRPNANELVALSDFLQDEFERNHGIRPQYMIPPGIDTKQFNYTVKERDIDILAVGSLIPLKQYTILAGVVAEVKKKNLGIKAVLIGNGPEKNKLQALIAEYGLQSTIMLTGELAHPEVLNYMQRTKVFLHPSSYEGFGVVAIEALQAGCRVISFCKPMKQEIEHWHIVRSKEEMCEKVLTILSDPSANYKRVTFSTMETTVKKIMDLFL